MDTQIQQIPLEYNQSLPNHHQRMNGQQINGHTDNGAPTTQHPSNAQAHMQQSHLDQLVEPDAATIHNVQNQFFGNILVLLQQLHVGSPIPKPAITAAGQQAAAMATNWAHVKMQQVQHAKVQVQAQTRAQTQAAQAHSSGQMTANLEHMPNGGMNDMRTIS